ncbi:hypothetical protein [Paludisphaera sp.]|uniref:hypothetical protein n=1 Tax=Paludisphaera sp. TaxID=2017432 RepID=UPI00301BDEE8
MSADRRTKGRAHRDATDLRVLEGRILTAVAVLSRKLPPTFHELATSPVLKGVGSAALIAALDDLAARGRIGVEIEPHPDCPLFGAPIVRYRALALTSGSTLKGGA